MTFDLLWEHGTKPGTQTPAFMSRPERIKRRDEGKRQYLPQICDPCWVWSKILKNQSVSFRFEVDGVGVYIKDHEKNLPEGSAVKSESSRHKGFIEQRETGDIVSQRLVSSSQDCTFKKETPPHPGRGEEEWSRRRAMRNVLNAVRSFRKLLPRAQNV